MQFGARPLKRAIQKYLEDELAELLLAGKAGAGDEIIVDFNPDEQKIDAAVYRVGYLSGGAVRHGRLHRKAAA